MAAASVRPLAPSLAKMLDTCTLTVLALMNSCRAISALLRPSDDQGEDLDLAPGEVVAGGVAVAARAVAARADAAAQLVEQRARAEPDGGRPGGVEVRAGLVGATGGAQHRAEAGLRPGGLERVAHRLEGGDGALPGRDKLVRVGGIDAGQPAQPQELGVEPLEPRGALGPERALALLHALLRLPRPRRRGPGPA